MRKLGVNRPFRAAEIDRCNHRFDEPRCPRRSYRQRPSNDATPWLQSFDTRRSGVADLWTPPTLVGLTPRRSDLAATAMEDVLDRVGRCEHVGLTPRRSGSGARRLGLQKEAVVEWCGDRHTPTIVLHSGEERSPQPYSSGTSFGSLPRQQASALPACER
jgi:hypothetical protein